MCVWGVSGSSTIKTEDRVAACVADANRHTKQIHKASKVVQTELEMQHWGCVEEVNRADYTFRGSLDS